MVMEILAVLPLQYSTVPFSAVRLFPVKVRVELMQEGSLVWLSTTLTPLSPTSGTTASPARVVTVNSLAIIEPVQYIVSPGSLQV